jgi:hypothetical protein
MKLTASVEGKTEIERIILIMNVGVVTALEQEILSIQEAENFLFSPYSMEKLKELGVDEKVIRLINLGCELENVERLLPDKLKASISDIKEGSLEILRSMPKPVIPAKKWID